MRTDILKYSVGLDVSSGKLEVCFRTMDMEQQTKIKATRKFANSKAGFKPLREWIEKHRKNPQIPLRVVMEATGVYHQAVAYFLTEQGYQLSIVLPNKSRKYMESLGLRSKNDSIDAKGLAQMGAEQRLEVWQPPSRFWYDLKALTRHRERLIKKQTDTRNQLHAQQHSAYPNTLVVKQLKSQLRTLERQKQQTQLQVDQLLEQDIEASRKVKEITDSIQGLGALTVATIVAETNAFQLFHSQSQLESYSGYDVIENQSGKRVGKTRISKRGNTHIRRALHFSALNVVRYKVKTFSDLYQRVHQRTQIKMKAYVAVQRKLLCLIYTLWKNDDVFNPDYLNELQMD